MSDTNDPAPITYTDGYALPNFEVKTYTGDSSEGGAFNPCIGNAYEGPVANIQAEYLYNNTTAPPYSDANPYQPPYEPGMNFIVSAMEDNTYIQTGSGDDAIQVLGGTNVLDGGTGSNFLTGGSGAGSFDTFFCNDDNPSADIWDTLNKFHSGDNATIWGLTPNDFTLSWVDGQGASGYTGLTLHATQANHPTASLTLVGYDSSDLTNGTLQTSYGTSGGLPYLNIHAT